MNLRCEIQKNVGEQANGAFRNRDDVSGDGQQTDVVSSRTDRRICGNGKAGVCVDSGPVIKNPSK